MHFGQKWLEALEEIDGVGLGNNLVVIVEKFRKVIVGIESLDKNVVIGCIGLITEGC